MGNIKYISDYIERKKEIKLKNFQQMFMELNEKISVYEEKRKETDQDLRRAMDIYWANKERSSDDIFLQCPKCHQKYIVETKWGGLQWVNDSVDYPISASFTIDRPVIDCHCGLYIPIILGLGQKVTRILTAPIRLR